MKYSFLLGEMTEGAEWYSPEERERVASAPKKGRLTLALSMIFLLFATYLSGGIVSADTSPEDAGDEIIADEVPFVSVMSGGAVNELDYVDVSAENEREARINELVTAYIEEHTVRFSEVEN